MKNKQGILVVEDDPAMCATCSRILSRAGYRADVVADGEAALAKLGQDPTIRIVLLDLKLPKMDGTMVLEKIKQLDPDVKVVIMTGFATVKSAVQTMKLGAVDYLVKPFEKNELLAVVAQQYHLVELEGQVKRLQTELHGKYRFDNLVGRSKKMEQVFERIVAARNNKANVLILGESGTGKEVIAKAIHYAAPTGNGAFVPVNCAALPPMLIESELFGHVKGAFTGAMRESIGLFRTANGGTIFLDEVFDMPLDTQAKLLRVLQERTVRSVGGLTEVPIDVRVICATNQDTEQGLQSGSVRTDLYYRLNVITIHVPALRERREDICRLIDHFAGRFAKTYGFSLGSIEPEVLEVLNHYSWPGNVRELENLVEQWFAMGRQVTVPSQDGEPTASKTIKSLITMHDLPPEIVRTTGSDCCDTGVKPANSNSPASPTPPDPSELMSLHDVERALALKALVAAGRNKSKAANLLGISRKKLYKLLNEEG